MSTDRSAGANAASHRDLRVTIVLLQRRRDDRVCLFLRVKGTLRWSVSARGKRLAGTGVEIYAASRRTLTLKVHVRWP